VNVTLCVYRTATASRHAGAPAAAAAAAAPAAQAAAAAAPAAAAARRDDDRPRTTCCNAFCFFLRDRAISFNSVNTSLLSSHDATPPPFENTYFKFFRFRKT